MRTLLTALLVIMVLTAGAQAPDTMFTNKFLLNFAVPDMPAAKALGTDPSNLLKPSDVQKFAASFQPFYSGGQGVIPKNFALEFAPWKLASSKWTLRDYNRGIKSLLYNSAFSIATVRDTSSYASKLSIGYHLTIGSKNSDILKAAYKTAFGNLLYASQDSMVSAMVAVEEYWVYTVQNQLGSVIDTQYVKANYKGFVKFLDSLWDKNIVDPTLKGKYDRLKRAFKLKAEKDVLQLFSGDSTIVKDPYKAIGKRIDNLINQWKDSMWNAGRWDIAIAWTAASKDTLIKNAQFSAFNLWVTKACQISNWGQLLLGGSLTLPRTEKNDTVTTNTSFTLNARLYAGTNSIKGFIETQYQYENFGALKKSLLFNLGGEFRIGQQFWAVASAGINNYLGISNPFGVLVSSLGIRYGFNKPK